MRVGKNEPIDTSSARVGSRGVSVPATRRLLSLAGIRREDHPRQHKDMVVVLIRHHLPGITNAEIIALLLEESGVRENDASKSLSNSLQRCSIFEDVCDPRDLKDDKTYFSDELKSYRMGAVSTLEFLKGKKWLGSTMLDTLSILKEGPHVVERILKRELSAKKKLKRNPAIYKTVADVQAQSVKDVAGAWVKRAFARKKYIASYPGVVPSTRSRSWGGAWTEAQVARHCLIWQWRQHFKVTGLHCPFDFGIPLLFLQAVLPRIVV